MLKWNLKQSLYGLFVFFLCFAIFSKLPDTNPLIKLSVPIFVFVFFGLLIHLKIDEKLFSWINLLLSLRNVGYADNRMNNFVPIKQIKNNIVYTNDGKSLAVLKTKPIDFSLLSEDEQIEVISSYRFFLRSLDFPCQISCRSVEVDLKKWYENMMENSKKTGNSERVQKMISWIKNNIEVNKTRTRIFYIIIPYDKRAENRNEDEVLILSERTQDIIKRLDKSGLKTVRMKNNELLSLFSSYFTDLSEIDSTFLSPITWLEKNSHKKTNKIERKNTVVLAGSP